MNILFILGNGFDLNLDMNTRYSDFYKYYTSINSQNSSINKLKEKISKDLENWSDLELALGKYTENLNTVEEFTKVFEDIGDNLADYLQLEEDTFDNRQTNRDKLFNYLAFPERSLLKADEDKLISFKNKSNPSIWNVNVITFNYTQSLEKLIGEKQKNVRIGNYNNKPIILKSIEHIHGYINDRMIMGVNDISQISNRSFHNNQEVLTALVKDKCNKAQKHTIDELCKRQISSANLICIFGSSIGVTDNIWWEIIGERLKSDCQLIIFDRCEGISPRRLYKIESIEEKMRNSFLNKTTLTQEEKKKFAGNIYFGLNSNMFKEVVTISQETTELA